MRVDLFDFTLPQGRVAHAPANPRDSAKLLHVGENLTDYSVRDLPAMLNAGDVLVFNNSRVIPARLFADVGGRQVELLLHQPLPQGNSIPHRGRAGVGALLTQPVGTDATCGDSNLNSNIASGDAQLPTHAPSIAQKTHEVSEWLAFARPARKLKSGMELYFAPDFTAIVEGRTVDGQVRLVFPYNAATLFNKLRAHGRMPLPPYIARRDVESDRQDYQTVYAAQDGSVAAPTAGLHFTPELLAALAGRGVKTAFVTLHVGAGTFQPVKVADTDDHIMHRERIDVGAEAAEIINAARAAGGKVIAVGTTSLRILESVAATDGGIAPFSGDTGIFITPGYRFKLVDRLMTNFHLPQSTLFVLVAAFAGLNKMHAAYAHAIAHDYRFYSYGDASFLERAA